MNYSKPEVAVLGDAACTIQGRKQGIGDSQVQPLTAPDCELDD